MTHRIREWEEKSSTAKDRLDILAQSLDQFVDFAKPRLLISEIRENEEGCWIMGRQRRWATVRRELASWLGIRPTFTSGRSYNNPDVCSDFGYMRFQCPKREDCIRPSHQEVMNVNGKILP